MKNIFFLSAILSFWLGSVSAQDSLSISSKTSNIYSETISYIQFNSIRDPANIGVQGRNFSLNTLTNLPNNYFNQIHNNISLDGYLNKNKDFGVSLYYALDNWSNQLFQNSLGLGIKKKIKNFHLGLGIERNTLYVDTNSLVFGDMIDPIKGIVFITNDLYSKSPVNTLNLKPSIIYNNSRLKIGVSINHLREEQLSILGGNSKVLRATNISASYLFHFKPKWSFVPLIQFNQSWQNKQLEIHSIVTFSDIRKTHFLDLSYTNQKSTSILYGMNFNHRFKFNARLNIPIYYSNYFPLSAQAGIQYTFQPKK